MRRVYDIVNKILDFIGVLLVSSLVLCLILQVIMRYFFMSPLSWSDEIACFNLVWITFYGAVLCSRDREHLEVSVLTDILPKHLKRLCIILSHVIVEIFLIILCFATIKLIQTNGTQLSPAVEIPMGILYVMLLVSSVLMFLFTAAHIVKDTVKIMAGA